MEIDIRCAAAPIVKTIIYGDARNGHDGYKLSLGHSMTSIESTNGDFVYIDTREDAENLIKALQKAIELSNWSE